MRLLLVCAAILSTCWTAAVPDPVASVTEPPPSINSSVPIFFIRSGEATDETEKYDRIFLYKHDKITKLLESGTSVAVADLPLKLSYLGSRDGIFCYDDSTEKVERYGTLHDNIISILKENRTDDLYILTEDRAVYKVTDGGTKKVEIPEAKGAEQIELDWFENLYYYGKDNQPFVVTSDGVKKIQGLPTFPDRAYLIKIYVEMNGIGLVSRNGSYVLHPDGSSEVFVGSEQQRVKAERSAQVVIATMDRIRQLESQSK